MIRKFVLVFISLRDLTHFVLLTTEVYGELLEAFKVAFASEERSAVIKTSI